MTTLAQHIRIFEAEPSDELVRNRQTTITALADAFKKRAGWANLLALADDLANGFADPSNLSSILSSQVAAAIAGPSPAFDAEGHQLEIAVIAALAALACVEDAKASTASPTKPDVLALGLWSALSFQDATANPKLERLRDDLLVASREQVAESAENARQRPPVNDPTFAFADDDDNAKLLEKFEKGPFKAIATLRSNAALDREEIDILWWALGNWSKLLQSRPSDLSDTASAIASGFEIAQLMKRLPAEAHRHLALRHIKNTQEPYSLTTLLSELGEARVALASPHLKSTLVTNCPRVFPLLSALAADGLVVSGVAATRPLSDWCSRAFLESSIVHLSTLPTVIS